MVQVRNIVSKKGWATTARFHAFKHTQILTIPSNHRAAFLAHVLLKMNVWILLKDPLYRETFYNEECAQPQRKVLLQVLPVQIYSQGILFNLYAPSLIQEVTRPRFERN